MKRSTILGIVLIALGATTACERKSPSQPVVTASERPVGAGGEQELIIEKVPVAEGIYMLIGRGGNIGVSVGDDGILIIDDQFADISEKIRAALSELSPGPLRYVLNTHHHGDHTGGNEVFGKNATIIAHSNVRKWLAKDAKPAAALPVITFDQSATVHINGETIRLVHFPNGHTDGDSVIFFEKANVVHTGDVFVHGRFPFVDTEHGGDLATLIKNIVQLIEMLGPETKIMPGHGPVAKLDDLRAHHAMITETSAFVQAQMAAGKSLEQIQKQGLPAKWEPWGTGFVSSSRWIETLYKGLSASQGQGAAGQGQDAAK